MYERGGKNDNTVFFLCKTCRISFCHTLLNKKLELTSFFFFCPKKKKKDMANNEVCFYYRKLSH